MVERNWHFRKYSLATLTAVLLFVAATYQITDGNTLLGVVFFASASCFSSLAGVYREREKREGIRNIDQ